MRLLKPGRSELPPLNGSEQKGKFSLERLIILCLVVCVGFLAVMLQKAENRPAPAFIVASDGSVAVGKPVDPYYHSDEELKTFTKSVYSGLYGWNYDAKIQGGAQGEVVAAALKLEGNLLNITLQEFRKNQVFEKVNQLKIQTVIRWRPTRVVKSDAPYEVIVEGDRQQRSLDGLRALPFAMKFTLQPTDRKADVVDGRALWLDGLQVVKIEDLRVK